MYKFFLLLKLSESCLRNLFLCQGQKDRHTELIFVNDELEIQFQFLHMENHIFQFCGLNYLHFPLC